MRAAKQAAEDAREGKAVELRRMEASLAEQVCELYCELYRYTCTN